MRLQRSCFKLLQGVKMKYVDFEKGEKKVLSALKEAN